MAAEPEVDVLDSILAAVLSALTGQSEQTGPVEQTGAAAASAPVAAHASRRPDAAITLGRDEARHLRVLDCGGGSGRRAVPLARRGATVTVIDSSIDALASLDRRAAEAGVADRVSGVQADIETLADLAPAGSVDLILLHEVLDSTLDAPAVMSAAATAVRPGGYLSVVVANPVAAVLGRALSGDLAAALDDLRTAADAGPTALDLAALVELASSAGLEVTARHGLGVFSALVPGAVLDRGPHARALLAELDRASGDRSPYREIAGQLHLLARRPVGPDGRERIVPAAAEGA